MMKNSKRCQQYSQYGGKTVGGNNIQIYEQAKISFMRKFAWRSVLLLPLAIGYVTSVNAAAIATGQIFWDTFTITANGNNITDSVDWMDQEDYIESSYWEGAFSNRDTVDHSIIPNSGWATSQTTVDGDIATTQTATIGPDLLSSTVDAAYTSESSSYINRFGSFVAPEDGAYTFSIDILTSVEINNLNTELLASSPGSQPNAFPYIELQYNNIDDRGNFVYAFHETTDLTNTFDSTGNVLDTLSIATRFDGVTPVVFSAGDTIEILATIDNFTRSFSNAPIPTSPPVNPVSTPATIWLFVTGLLLLQRLRRIS